MFADSKFPLGRVSGCVYVRMFPLMDWRPVQGVFSAFTPCALQAGSQPTPPRYTIKCEAGKIMNDCMDGMDIR